MKKSQERYVTGKAPRLTITKGIISYIIVFILALIFTQTLRSPISSIFFVFVLLLPFTMLLYLFSAHYFIKSSKDINDITILKKTPYKFKFALLNKSFIPYPFIDAYVRLPQINNVRINIRKIYLSLLPKNSYTFSNTVKFRFRGTYEMGIDYIYVYDLFRLFRLKIKIDESINIFVIPRKLILDSHNSGVTSNCESTTKKSLIFSEKVEMNDTREYRIGDSLKSIHWKLSSKSDDFIVRDYETGTSKKSYIYVDLSSPYPHSPATDYNNDKKIKKNVSTTCSENIEQSNAEYNLINEPIDISFYEDMNEYCADGVVELAIGTVLNELQSGNKCNLIWFDSRSEGGVAAYSLSTVDDFLMIYNYFSTAPLSAKDKNLFMLCKLVKSPEDTKQVYITSAIDKASIDGLCSCSVISNFEHNQIKDVILFNPAERYKNIKERNNYIQGCYKHLAMHGLRLLVYDTSTSAYNV